ncbi:MAG: flavin reductase family protein [Spirochaetaceae bacterium]|nr:MAG: flavin reductase family protein [Spirochaetaceae bacterium]
MELKLEHVSTAEVYKLLIGCVVPRPIAWITSQSLDGVVNLAPFSFFNAVASNPPTISVSFAYNVQNQDGLKDTLANIQQTGEFVVNTATEPHEVHVNESAINYPRERGEPHELGIETLPSALVLPPRLALAPVALECRLERQIPVGEGPGSATLVLARVLHAYIRDELVNERMHVDVKALAPIGRLAGHDYCYVHEVFTLRRRSFEEHNEVG